MNKKLSFFSFSNKGFIITSIVVFLFLQSFSGLKAQDTLVYWNFPIHSQVATGGISVNTSKIISRESSFSGNYQYSASDAPGSLGDSCIYTSAWNSGSGTKYWQIELSTAQHNDIKVFSKQTSSGTGPQDFVLEYSLNNVDWYQVGGSTITIATANDWTSGVLTNLPLPAVCFDQPNVFLRWIMASDISVSGGTVASAGTSKIDDIYIIGHSVSAPVVTQAYAISDSVVIAKFSKSVDSISATTIANYSFKGTTGIDSIVRTYLAQVNIYLNPKLVAGQPDTLIISNVEDLSGIPMSSPQSFKILYNITQDTIPPSVISVNTLSCNVIEIMFSEPVDAVTATDFNNYLISGSTALDSVAELNATQDVVTLTLHVPGLTSGLQDSILISNIEDLEGNVMDSTYKYYIYCLIKECIAYWNFDDQDLIADGGISANLSSQISRESGFSGTYSFPSQGSPAPSVSTTKWDNGSGVKYWEINFTSYVISDPLDGKPYNYDSLTVSSKQRSSGSGPQDFMLQYYDFNTSTWVDVSGGSILVNDNWTSGVLQNVPLPEECWGAANVRLRWVMTSDVSTNGGTVSSAGVSNLDALYICGVKLPGNIPDKINDFNNVDDHLVIFPNPANDLINISSSSTSLIDIEMYDVRGSKIYSAYNTNSNSSINVSSYPAGLYILSIYNKNSQSYIVRKVLIK